jgi:polyphosphate kinase
MERLKFIGIFSSNLDEFYSIRVGSLHRMIVDPQHHPTPPGVKPKFLVKQILKEVNLLNERVEVVISDIFSSLHQKNIYIADEQSISDSQRSFVSDYFTNTVRNHLFPMMLNTNLEFPYLKHVAIYLAIDMYRSMQPLDRKYALIEIPTGEIPRYIALPKRNKNSYFIMLDDVIRLNLKEIFNVFPYDRYEAYTIKITRDGEYDLEEEVTKSLYEKLSTSIKQRKEGVPVRFVYDKNLPKKLLEYITEHANLKECRIVIPGGKYHNARDMISFPQVGNEALYFEAQPPLLHHTLRNGIALIPQVEDKDRLITLPYHRFSYVIDLLREASLDDTVTSIKMTLYRVPENSSVLNALCNAARNGKKVTIYIELQARFDEELNMYWMEKLTREHNISLISGVEGVKVHSKICVITRKSKKGKSHIAIIGTGNFNENTARQYSDHVLLTADPRITEEVNKVFILLDRGFSNVKFKHLIISPFHTRTRFVNLIKKEISFAKEGKEAEIIVKINNLVDKKMIKHLLKASEEGVAIRLIIRGICSMDTENLDKGNIQGKAMIDRYLEHTRVVRFANGGSPLYYIGSADWMERNLDNRIEVMTPIFDLDLQAELNHFLQAHWDDTYSSFSLNSDTFNQSLQTGENEEYRAQRNLYRWYKDKLIQAEAVEA